MKYFSTRGGGQLLSFEEVYPLLKRPIPILNDMLPDSPHWSRPGWRPLYPRTHSVFACGLADEVERLLLCRPLC